MKKCKVVIVPVEDKDHNKYPFVVDSFNNIRKLYKNVWIDDDEKCAHIEFRDENNNLVATTYQPGKNLGGVFNYLCKNPSIPQSFIDQFIVSNGSIKEVMIEMISDITPIDPNKDELSLTFSVEVIIHPVKTEMKISNIPIKDIKSLVELTERSYHTALWGYLNQMKRVRRWLKDNNL